MRNSPAAAVLLLILALVVPALAGSGPPTPAPGSAERKAILQAVRAPVEKELKRKVVFKVDYLKVQNGWAFLRGVPRQPNGAPMDYRGTVYQEAIKYGAFDDWIGALLHKQEGRWRVVTYRIGATDVAYEGWDREYKAPATLFR